MCAGVALSFKPACVSGWVYRVDLAERPNQSILLTHSFQHRTAARAIPGLSRAMDQQPDAGDTTSRKRNLSPEHEGRGGEATLPLGSGRRLRSQSRSPSPKRVALARPEVGRVLGGG